MAGLKSVASSPGGMWKGEEGEQGRARFRLYRAWNEHIFRDRDAGSRTCFWILATLLISLTSRHPRRGTGLARFRERNARRNEGWRKISCRVRPASFRPNKSKPFVICHR